MMDRSALLTHHPANLAGGQVITTFTGVKIKLPNLHPTQVRFADMVQGLSNTCRYQGQCDGPTSSFYSVAEHQVLVAMMAQAAGEPDHIIKACMLHDAHEYLTGDWPSPLKPTIAGLRDFEGQVERAVRWAFPDLRGVRSDEETWTVVKHYDILALHLEASQLLKHADWVDQDVLDMVPLDADTSKIKCLDPYGARLLYVAAFDGLGMKRPIGDTVA